MANNQVELFDEVWRENEHVCALCEAPLGNIPMSFHFSHILGKGAYPRLKLLKENIMLNCFDCHREWDQGDPTKLKNYQFWESQKQELRLKHNTNQL